MCPNLVGRLLSGISPTAAGAVQQHQSGRPAADPEPSSSPTDKLPSPTSCAQSGSEALLGSSSPSSQGRTDHLPPQQQQQDSAGTGKRSTEQQQLLDGPGSVYSVLPCIKQLRPSRSAADQLAAAVLGALPGVCLDSSWRVYPSGPRSGPQKAEAVICILPDLQPPVSQHADCALVLMMGDCHEVDLYVGQQLCQQQQPILFAWHPCWAVVCYMWPAVRCDLICQHSRIHSLIVEHACCTLHNHHATNTLTSQCVIELGVGVLPLASDYPHYLRTHTHRAIFAPSQQSSPSCRSSGMQVWPCQAYCTSPSPPPRPCLRSAALLWSQRPC